MYELNKQRFGTFVAERRKALGLTQTALAEKVHVSNKAVSKWETGVSLPDVSILIPLSEVLGVTVTELLEGRHIEPKTELDSGHVEQLVQSVLRYPAQNSFETGRKKRLNIFLSCVLLSALEGLLIHLFCVPISSWSAALWLSFIFGIVFGSYFMLLVKPLPAYHDQYKIQGMHSGFLRMNMPGLYFNNRNWPHIVRVGQIWSMALLVVYPAVHILMNTLVPEVWPILETGVFTAAALPGLFVPMYAVGQKYE